MHQAAEGVQIHGEQPDAAVAVAQVAVHEPPHGLVGNAQARRALAQFADAEQAEVVQQGQEVLALIQMLQREAAGDFAVHPAGADEVAQQVEVAVELPVDGEQVAQLAVVVKSAQAASEAATFCRAARCAKPGLVRAAGGGRQASAVSKAVRLRVARLNSTPMR